MCKQSGVLLGLIAFFCLGLLSVGRAAAPYPQSSTILRLTWGTDVLKLRPGAGDNWPITWAGDDLQITAYGDGDGFDGKKRDLSLGFATVSGDPPNHWAEDFPSDADTPEGGGSSGIKASGLLMVDGMLYMFIRNYRLPGSDDFTNARLASSRDRGANWVWADWHFSDTFGCPEFVQVGKDYTGARDKYVYIVSQANDSAYGFSPDIVLARAPKTSLLHRSSYEFFAGFSGKQNPTWSPDIEKRKPIFTDPNGTQRVAITYNAGLQRYFLTTSHRPPGSKATHTPALGIFEAPQPWGPWATVYYDHDWSKGSRTYHHKFPTKWISPDGKTMWLLFSGLDGGYYSFCLKKAVLEVSPSPNLR
jgi:hypothetical protein